MKTLTATSLKYSDQQLWILDQHRLPHDAQWLRCDNVEQMVAFIQNLQVRGAPLIAIAASLLIGHLAEQQYPAAQLKNWIAQLRAARPTAVNLMHAMDRLLLTLAQHGASALADMAVKIFEEDVELCARIAAHGAALIKTGDHLLTHCNTGSLATAGIGTALGVIQIVHQQHKNIHVYVDETRPLLQGGRLTTWELQQQHIPHTLITDSMAAVLMQQGKINAVLVGADRIAVNGDTANKIGTYSLAINAHHHHVPFYVVAPSTTVDRLCTSGSEIPIEQRNADEVRGVSGNFGKVNWAPENTPVFNPAFDITPAKLISGWILESGIYTQQAIAAGALKLLGITR
jgi:methylthioribose-1-phosphate isomerase